MPSCSQGRKGTGTVPLFTIEGGSNLKAGSYPVTLIDIKPDTIITNDRGEQDIFRWKFIVDDGSDEGVEHNAISSQNTSPRSKLFGWLTALLGEDAVKVGMDFDKKDLVGREAIGQFTLDADGWAKLTALVEKPKSRARGVEAEEAPATPF